MLIDWVIWVLYVLKKPKNFWMDTFQLLGVGCGFLGFDPTILSALYGLITFFVGFSHGFYEKTFVYFGLRFFLMIYYAYSSYFLSNLIRGFGKRFVSFKNKFFSSVIIATNVFIIFICILHEALPRNHWNGISIYISMMIVFAISCGLLSRQIFGLVKKVKKDDDSESDSDSEKENENEEDSDSDDVEEGETKSLIPTKEKDKMKFHTEKAFKLFFICYGLLLFIPLIVFVGVIHCFGAFGWYFGWVAAICAFLAHMIIALSYFLYIRSYKSKRFKDLKKRKKVYISKEEYETTLVGEMNKNVNENVMNRVNFKEL